MKLHFHPQNFIVLMSVKPGGFS